ncbi:translation initiation factor IF-2 [Malassezia vespertilionis]|uniref:translation initiation factor IF-2 n=1 Tax=Malassezia vespertilionis TaxID=2020962 RepID=UPI0024B09BAD|nr:translation initiation factor IF-2 [Malassezia vespertilionis]WFD07830.1 translation initiation factor IF-2 [Malassezia vespertilionis]
MQCARVQVPKAQHTYLHTRVALAKHRTSGDVSRPPQPTPNAPGKTMPAQRKSQVPSAKNWAQSGARKYAPQHKNTFSPPPKAPLKQEAAHTKQISLPRVISVEHLARILGVNMRMLQFRMEKIGLTDTRADHLLKFEDAELLAAEYNAVTSVDEERAFDIHARPFVPASEQASLPLRPPVVTIMGHVDHGKTTLLDTLRSSSVAQGEAGGITQHIGAFSVPVQRKGQGGIDTVTFLDTPGHAAFSMMRSRGASVTDIVVLVVAADDGVMPQTKEVIQLVHGDQGTRVPLVVVISKIDAPNADVEKVKYALMGAGIAVEELGGEIPCVEISARKHIGIDTLEETLALLAELAELRAEKEGAAEGRVLESRVEKGRGNVATVLVQRGVLRPSDTVLAGTAWAKVRQLTQPDGKPTKAVYPGYPAQVAGWRELPAAGDAFLGADEAACKRAVESRKRRLEQASLLEDAEKIDETRRRVAEAELQRERLAYEERQQLRELRRKESEGSFDADALEAVTQAQRAARALNETHVEKARKELLLILKGDFSGTVEALSGAVSGIGNTEAVVRIVSQSVGDPTEGDVHTAHAIGGQVLGFNVKAPKGVQSLAARLQPRVAVHCDDVIYRLMEHVTSQVAALLPPVQELRVHGEAHVSQIFQIKGSGRAAKSIAGCRVTNGLISRANQVRILRGAQREEVFRGKLDALRQVKKDVSEMRKGTECGMSFDGFDEVCVDDVVQCFTTVDVPQTL